MMCLAVNGCNLCILQVICQNTSLGSFLALNKTKSIWLCDSATSHSVVFSSDGICHLLDPSLFSDVIAKIWVVGGPQASLNQPKLASSLYFIDSYKALCSRLAASSAQKSKRCQYWRQEDDHAGLLISYQEMSLLASDGMKIPKYARSVCVTQPLHHLLMMPCHFQFPLVVSALICCFLL